jgi:hypothetical protein
MSWLKRLLGWRRKPENLGDSIMKKYLHHPMLARSLFYQKNPDYWAHYWKCPDETKKNELKEFERLIDEFTLKNE